MFPELLFLECYTVLKRIIYLHSYLHNLCTENVQKARWNIVMRSSKTGDLSPLSWEVKRRNVWEEWIWRRSWSVLSSIPCTQFAICPFQASMIAIWFVCLGEISLSMGTSLVFSCQFPAISSHLMVYQLLWRYLKSKDTLKCHRSAQFV